MYFKQLIALNIFLVAAFGWWISFHYLSNKNDHDDIDETVSVLDRHEIHHYIPFAEDEPFPMTETDDAIYFDGDNEFD